MDYPEVMVGCLRWKDGSKADVPLAWKKTNQRDENELVLYTSDYELSILEMTDLADGRAVFFCEEIPEGSNLTVLGLSEESD